jgi:hypothetical protein
MMETLGVQEPFAPSPYRRKTNQHERRYNSTASHPRLAWSSRSLSHGPTEPHEGREKTFEEEPVELDISARLLQHNDIDISGDSPQAP